MSDDDRLLWNQRYLEGAYGSRTHPSALLVEWLDRLPRGRALDVACGAGRNARYLAANGYTVVAVDISAVALETLGGVPGIQTISHDLDHGLPSLGDSFDLIIKMRFLNLDLLPALIDHLRPGGVLVCEVLLAAGAGATGPASPRFRAAPGALRAAAGRLEPWYDHEGEVIDPDGRVVHLARFIGRKPLSVL